MSETLERLESLYDLLKENNELFIHSFLVATRNTNYSFFSTEDWKLELILDRFPNFDDPQEYWRLLAGRIIIIFNENIRYSKYDFTHRIMKGKSKLILSYNPIGRKEEQKFSIKIESKTTTLWITFLIKDIEKTFNTISDNPDYSFIKEKIEELKTKPYREGKLKTEEEYTFLSRIQ